MKVIPKDREGDDGLSIPQLTCCSLPPVFYHVNKWPVTELVSFLMSLVSQLALP